jgi:uncharacterized protein (TIGR03437 family)
MLKTHALALIALIFEFAMAALAQQSRITAQIDNSQRVTLTGHLHPLAKAQYDQGALDPSTQLSRVTVTLQPSAAQQAQLKQLLAEQQDPSSPNYHKWLTPEEYASRFGVSVSDINTIAQWLRSQNLTITSVARGRNSIAVSGTASAVENAFQVQLDRFVINGETHFAPTTEPSVPAAFSGVISGIRGLNDFRLKPAHRRKAILQAPSKPQVESESLCGGYCLGPSDVATIYDINALYNKGWNGSGQSLAVVGQSAILTSDIDAYRSAFNLPAINLQQTLVPGSQNPGTVSGDEGESDLDIELSGGIAQNATIVFVYSEDVTDSVQYAIDQNVAPVISMSYGECENESPQSDATSMQQLAEQANAQGITWLASSGDSGAAACYDPGVDSNTTASVNLPASVPEVTGVGGTEFNEGTGTYWSSTGAALGYIPEIAWNDTAEDAGSCGQELCPSASGGGPSVFFAKPSWQTGDNVPADGARDVPDISLSASADHDGYIIYSSDGCGGVGRSREATTCEQVVGGTSAGPPNIAGLLTLFNQGLIATGAQSAPGQGNINPQLYREVQSTPSAFHDITVGNNIITFTCSEFQRGCTGASVGYDAGPGYDLVTGIGTVDGYNLWSGWVNTSGKGPGAAETSSGPPSIGAATNGFSYTESYAPGMFIAVFGAQLAPSTQTASAPLPTQLAGVSATVNGLAVPIYYVSPTQLNLQIPYEVPVGTATLTIDNNGETSSTQIQIAATAPGILTSSSAPVPDGSGEPGQELVLYITGGGLVSPSIADGAAPAAGTAAANLPMPQAGLSVTVGGIQATVNFAGIGVGLVGVMQVNYTVPANVSTGAQPVIVSVGGVASPAATLTVLP